MAYAVVRTGGKQHRVQQGERLKVDKLAGAEGTEITLGEVLLWRGEAAPKVGQPLLSDVKVTARIIHQARDRKILVFKRRRRKGFHKIRGHRQDYTELEILDIVG